MSCSGFAVVMAGNGIAVRKWRSRRDRGVAKLKGRMIENLEYRHAANSTIGPSGRPQLSDF